MRIFFPLKRKKKITDKRGIFLFPLLINFQNYSCYWSLDTCVCGKESKNGLLTNSCYLFSDASLYKMFSYVYFSLSEQIEGI